MVEKLVLISYLGRNKLFKIKLDEGISDLNERFQERV